MDFEHPQESIKRFQIKFRARKSLKGEGNKEVSLKAETSDVICVRKNTFKYLFTCVRDPSRGSNSFELVNICKRCCQEIVRFPNFRSPLFSFCFVYSVICCDGYKLERSFFERCFLRSFLLFSWHFTYCQPVLKWNISNILENLLYLYSQKSPYNNILIWHVKKNSLYNLVEKMSGKWFPLFTF